MSDPDKTNPQITQITPINTDKKDLQTHAIIGAAMEVHTQLGSGFVEAVYHAALAVELAARGIRFVREVELPVFYKGGRLPCSFRVDFICYEGVIVELKAMRDLTGIEESQGLNYLKASGLERGLLLNFGRGSLSFKRLVFSHPR